jgi:hypothetical protein
MILDGNLHGDGAVLARYMQTGKDGETATVVQFRAPEFSDAIRSKPSP